MEFVFSFWYIVMAVLVVCIAACITVFVMMDKKDKVLIDEFVKNASTEQKAEKVSTEEKSQE